jgi:hypothetical protein
MILKFRLHGSLHPQSGSMVAVKRWRHCAYVALRVYLITLADNDQFQYIALTRYCQNTHAARKPLQQALTEMEKKLASVQDLASKEQAKVVSLEQENERLRLQKDQYEAMKAEAQRLQGLDKEVAHFRNVNPKDLATFLANKSAIRHYLKLVPMLVE